MNIVGVLSSFFTRNWTLKISAFGVALILWVAVRAETPNRQEVPGIPVQVQLTDPQWALIGDPTPNTVTVRFGGPSRELIRMAVDRPSIEIPLETVLSGDSAVVLQNQWVGIQDRPGVVVEDIQPSSVRLTLEPVERVVMPAAPRWTGELPVHLALGAIPVANPAEVRVVGPRSAVAAVDSVPLQPVDLSTINGSGPVQVAVDSAALSGLMVQPMQVQVAFQVEDRIERVVSGIPVVLPESLENADEFEVRPQTGSVILSGARAVVERADPTTFQLVVQLDPSRLPTTVGGEEVFPITLSGLPDLLIGERQQTTVTLRRVAVGEP